MKLSWIDEFVSDWVLSGKSSTTADAYKKNLILLFKYCAEPQVVDIKKWLHGDVLKRLWMPSSLELLNG